MLPCPLGGWLLAHVRQRVAYRPGIVLSNAGGHGIAALALARSALEWVPVRLGVDN